MSVYLPVATLRPAPARIPVRVYSISPLWKTVYIIAGAALAVGGAVGVWYFLFDEGAPGGGAGKALAAMCGVFVMMGCGVIIHTLVYKFFLGPAEIAISGFMYRRRMRRSDILGRRTQKSNGLTFIRLFPVRKGIRRLVLIQDLKADRAYHNWLATIPDLDEREDLEATREFLENREFGDTPQQRKTAFKSAHIVAGVLNGLASVAALWFLFFPKPYGFLVAVTAAMPPIAVAMALAWRGRFALHEAPKTDKGGHPSLSLLFMLPAIALATRGWLDVEVLDWKIALIASLAAGAVLSAVIIGAMVWGARQRTKPYAWLVIWALVTVWCGGAVVFSDSLFDRSSPAGYEVRVVKKSQSTGKLRTLRFTLEPWGPVTTEESVTVPNQALYDRIAPGDTVCVILHPGAFRISWIEVWGCR